MIGQAIGWAAWLSAGLALAAAVGLAGLAVVSWRAGRSFHLDRATGAPMDLVVRFRQLRFARGGVLFSGSSSRHVNSRVDWAREPPPLNSGWRFDAQADLQGVGFPPAEYPSVPGATSHAGVAWQSERGPGWWSAEVVVPAAVPVVALALPATAIGVGRVRRRRRSTAGRCHACGYDLRATLGRCPECGAVAV